MISIGGGKSVQFVSSSTALEEFLHKWMRQKCIRKGNHPSRAVCIIQHSLATRRRMLIRSSEKTSIYEMRVFCVITGGKNKNVGENETAAFKAISIENGSIYMHDQIRVKVLEVNAAENSKALLLNKRIHDNNSSSKLSSLYFSQLYEDMGEMQKKLRSKTIPEIAIAIASSVNATCFTIGNNQELPNESLMVGAFDFIVDKEGKPWLLEVNIKPWLRWSGVGQKQSYPGHVARSIAKSFLEELISLMSTSKVSS